MLWLIRMGAYALSGFVIWQSLQSGAGPVGYFPADRSLTLNPDEGLVFGVCAGISKYTGFDVSLIRLGWALAAFYRGIGVLLYLLAFFLIPT